MGIQYEHNRHFDRRDNYACQADKEYTEKTDDVSVDHPFPEDDNPSGIG